MTAKVMRRDWEACLAARMNEFVAKPVQAEAPISVLQRLLEEEPGAEGMVAA